MRPFSAIRQFMGGIRAFFGKRQRGLEPILVKAREEAIREMKSNARMMGADQIIGVDIDASEISAGGNSDGFIVFIAYGTAICKKGKKIKSFTRSRSRSRSRSVIRRGGSIKKVKSKRKSKVKSHVKSSKKKSTKRRLRK